MSVRIPIAADASAVVGSFDQIASALRRAGQAGKELKDVDLSHPELRKFADDLKIIEKRMVDLANVGRGTTARVAREIISGAGGPLQAVLSWQTEMERRFPDHAQRNRVMANAGRYLFAGTSLSSGAPTPPSPPPGAPPPGAPPRAPKPGGSGGSGLLSTLSGPLKFLLSAAGLSGIYHMAGTAIGQASSEDVSTDTLLRSMHGAADDFTALRDSVRKTTEGLMLTYGEAQRLSLGWVRLTNELDPNKVQQNVRLATGLARGYGIDPGETTQTLGRAAYLGEDPRRFAMLIAEAAREGGQSGQVSDVMKALLAWSEQASRVLVTHTNVEGFASMMSGMMASGEPGLKGAAGIALINQVNSAIMGGGRAGAAGQAFMYQALAAQGITDPYEMQYAMQGGMFEHVGKRGTTVYDAVREQLNKEYPQGSWGANMRRWNAESNLFGINMRQAQGLDSFKPGDVDRAQSILSRYGLDLSQVDPTAMGEIAGVLGPHADLNAERQKLLARTGSNALMPEEASALKNVEGSSLQYMLVRLLASHGMEKTEGTKIQDSVSALSNALTAAGTGLIPVISDLRGTTADLLKSVGKLSEWLEKKYPDAKAQASAGDSVDLSTWDPMTGTGNFGETGPVVETTISGAGRGSGSDAIASLAPDVEAEVRARAKALGLDPDHMVRLAEIEHGGKDGISPAGAIGPMQLMPGTASQMGVDPTDWRQNIKGGEGYYKNLLHLFHGNVAAADAAYNAGPGNPGVRYFAQTGDPSYLPAKTQRYVKLSQLPPTLHGPVAPERRSASTGDSRADKQFRIEPLKIIHQTPSGETIGTTTLPVTGSATAPPWGGIEPLAHQAKVIDHTQAIVAGMMRAHTAAKPKPVIAPDSYGA